MYCSRYNISYYRSIDDTFHTILDYCDILDTELTVSHTYSNQEVPWVRGRSTGFFPRHNKFHSFSFKTLTDSLSWVNPIPESRLAMFGETLLTDSNKDDFILVTLGDVPAVPLSGCNIETRQSILLINPSVDTVESGFDDLFSDKLWKTYTIKYSDFIINPVLSAYVITDQLSVILTDQNNLTLYSQMSP